MANRKAHLARYSGLFGGKIKFFGKINFLKFFSYCCQEKQEVFKKYILYPVKQAPSVYETKAKEIIS